MEQAEGMVKRSSIELAPGQIGDNVAIPIPLVDRGRGDPQNILPVILDRSDNNNHTLAIKHGILKVAYKRKEFELFLENVKLILHQMRISTTEVPSVVLRPKKLKIREKKCEKCIRAETRGPWATSLT
jgi:hypothetical protein